MTQVRPEDDKHLQAGPLAEFLPGYTLTLHFPPQ